MGEGVLSKCVLHKCYRNVCYTSVILFIINEHYRVAAAVVVQTVQSTEARRMSYVVNAADTFAYSSCVGLVDDAFKAHYSPHDEDALLNVLQGLP